MSASRARSSLDGQGKKHARQERVPPWVGQTSRRRTPRWLTGSRRWNGGGTQGGTRERPSTIGVDRLSAISEEIWSRRSDLNRGPADYESAALPTELRRPGEGTPAVDGRTDYSSRAARRNRVPVPGSPRRKGKSAAEWYRTAAGRAGQRCGARGDADEGVAAVRGDAEGIATMTLNGSRMPSAARQPQRARR